MVVMVLLLLLSLLYKSGIVFRISEFRLFVLFGLLILYLKQ